MRKNFLFGLAVLMVSFFVLSCSKEDDSSKETGKKSEIVKEENSKEEETPNQGDSNSSDNNSNQENNSGENNNQDNNSSENNDGTNNEEGESSSKMFVYKVLVEDITGTWCPNCPRVTHTIENMKRVSHINERVVPVAIHSEGEYRNYDPMAIDQERPIYNYYKRATGDLNLTGLPYFAKNRKQRLYASNALENIDTYLTQNKTSPIGIKISSELNDKGGKVTVNLKFKENYSNLKYTVYVIENKIIYEQRNSTHLYGGGYLRTFEHNDVLRAIYGETMGNSLGSVKKGEEVIKKDLQLNYSLLSAGKLSNVKVVVFVSDATTNEVLNVQEAKANETKDYQYAE
ncbi:MAG: Omp28-related outer membrane protein [Capnocytophaga felis]|nr:Omp28-related outer membrane protein [Capnocytophaga felis]